MAENTAKQIQPPLDYLIRRLEVGAQFRVPADSRKLMREKSNPEEIENPMPYAYRLTHTNDGYRLLDSSAGKIRGIVLFAPDHLKEGDVLEIVWVCEAQKLKPNSLRSYRPCTCVKAKLVHN